MTSVSFWIPAGLIALAVGVFCISWVMQRLAPKIGAMDTPSSARKIHTHPTPLLGGVGIGLVLACASVVAWMVGAMSTPLLLGFLVGVGVILVTGLLDDVYGVAPWIRFSAYALAVGSLMYGGVSIEHVTHWSGRGAVLLGGWSAPLTFVWLYVVLFATKLMDGMDGLVTGQTVIASATIAALCFFTPFYQPVIGVMALGVLCAFAGFFPWNRYPARQFLGESGSVLAGFCIGFLATLSSAKIATAFMAVGVPIADAGIVILGRLWRRQSMFQGDTTHLHFKLLRYGLRPTQIILLYWGIAITAGLIALAVQSKGKLLLAAALVGITVVLSFLTGTIKQRV